eukprot:GHVL01016700.1.p1 GENE.GHVL01016700.1~~GHVL01016700.1.p1  ORF type:complete len:421 (-),score=99.21 GHVL01016700.1:30-1292(-)
MPTSYSNSTPGALISVLTRIPIRMEVWEKDNLAADELIAEANIDASRAFQMPLTNQHRCYDATHPLVPTKDDSSTCGVLRVLFFLEEMGVSSSSPHGILAIPPNNLKGETKIEQVATLQMELWRQTEKAKFQSHIRQLELSLTSKLENEFAEKEQKRAAEFDEKWKELCHLESKTRRKIEELKNRDLNLQNEEARIQIAKEQLRREISLSEEEIRTAGRRAKDEFEISLLRETSKHQEVSKKLAEVSKQYGEVNESKRLLEERVLSLQKDVLNASAPTMKLTNDLNMKIYECDELRRQLNAMRASRDHFREAVERLSQEISARETKEKRKASMSDNHTKLRELKWQVNALTDDEPCNDRSDKREYDQRASPSHEASLMKRLASLEATKENMIKGGLYGTQDITYRMIEDSIATVKRQLND